MKTRVRAAAAAAVIVAACSLGASAASAYRLPPANGQFDYQIGGAYRPAPAVRVVSRDRLTTPVRGKYNVCYVNTFQTQPDEIEWWRANHDDLLLKDALGNYVGDVFWGELVLDVRTPEQREAIADIMEVWFRGCAESGFDAIEPDNLDTWSRSEDLIDPQDNIDTMYLLADRAHDADLAIAQKNVPEVSQEGHDRIDFDFSIVEECQVWRECRPVLAEYGGRTYEIEYTDNEERPGDGGLGYWRRACNARGATISVILRDRYVTPGGDPDHVYRAC